MDVDTYLEELLKLAPDYAARMPGDTWDVFGKRWFHSVAPSKTEEYGTEAWMRMGSKGILAELSGCHYRCRRFVAQGRKVNEGRGDELKPGDFYDPVYDAVIDSFGYSVMLRVCCSIECTWRIPMDWSIANQVCDPDYDNEYLLQTHWDKGDAMGSLACAIALRSSLNSWRLLT